MEGMKDIMKKIASSKGLEVKHHSELCNTHNIPKMSVKGTLNCPRCFLEGLNNEEDKLFMEELKRRDETVKARYLSTKSIIEDETIKLARFDNYEAITGTEEYNHKVTAYNIAKRYENGELFNTFIVSPITGVGKSHLAMAILKECNGANVSTLFLDVSAALRKIRGSFKNPESKYTEQYIIDICTEADILVLDDLGAETGDIDTQKKASEYTSNILRAIMNNRQTKSTIITTNLDSKKLTDIYDGKVVSRMLRKREVIKFVNTKDKRAVEF